MNRHILVLCLLGNPYELVNGGHQRTIYEIIEYFKFHEDLIFTIITTTTQTQKGRFQKLHPNIDYYEIGIPMLWTKKQDNLYIHKEYLFNQVSSICSHAKTPISLLHSTYWISGIIGTELSKKYNIPQIHSPISCSYEKTSNGFQPKSYYQRESEDATFKNASLILSITKAEYDILHKEYNVNPNKILIIGRTVGQCFLQPAHLISGNLDMLTKTSWLNNNLSASNYNDWWIQNAFCYVGRIVDYKGIKEIIQAWEILFKKYHEKTPPLWIIGGDCVDIATYRTTITELVPDLPLYEETQKICWWGYITSEGISNILLKCNTLIMHSGFEPGGRVILEALSMGKPIISTPFGFARDYIKNWYNGFNVEYQDIFHLASCMELFVKNPYLSNMLGINAQHIYQDLEQSWGYFSTLEKIYATYTIEQNFKNCNSVFLTESEKKEFLIDAFPYCDIKNSLDDISNQFHVSKSRIETITSPYSYLWQAEFLIIKQYFNRLNETQLWNRFAKQKVVCLVDLYQAAIYSAQFHPILPICQKSDIYFTYAMPLSIVLTKEHTINHMPELLNKFQEETTDKILSLEVSSNLSLEIINRTFQTQHKYFTTKLLLNELMIAIEENITLFSSIELSYIFEIMNHLNRKNIQNTYTLNYGKSLLGHMVQWKSELYLLPSSEIFWGESGFDMAITYIDYYGESIFTQLLTANDLDSNIILWICCLLTQNYVQTKILMQKTTFNVSEILKIIKEWLA